LRYNWNTRAGLRCRQATGSFEIVAADKPGWSVKKGDPTRSGHRLPPLDPFLPFAARCTFVRPRLPKWLPRPVTRAALDPAKKKQQVIGNNSGAIGVTRMRGGPPRSSYPPSGPLSIAPAALCLLARPGLLARVAFRGGASSRPKMTQTGGRPTLTPRQQREVINGDRPNGYLGAMGAPRLCRT